MAAQLKPTVLWAQRQDSVFVTIDIKDAINVKVDLTEIGLNFSAKGSDTGNEYAFAFDFFKPIVRERSKWSTKRCPEFFLRKQEEGTWSKLQKEGKLTWVKVDWSRWADSDEEEEKGGFDVDGMDELDFSGLTAEEAEGSDGRDSILADLDEDVAVTTDEEEEEQDEAKAGTGVES
mmetsp:Transcript_33994/g.51382  ORF Transcript_33994/g.51382 Transcript_33994/m.51382 type:complete len:176 (-) Transcript_33994:151-678(-)|eukprot:CAMPEP_0206458092 /NCGR_PEP_ID=MMETSP0324_2-20121206/23355_1 /ASSEMBLY_ACC=CAM_ASM_000836 /TAXON_ID=2866 /ORGANISM="Crypthecodinium cohnii, Strain Seligo" /LENGTH=175 /DNA_ID=CAMNT_0053929347 /DNA_START=114 /DNA_END=641 /DNA_ORIENTATION=-